MPNKPAAKKALRQSIKKHVRNTRVKNKIRGLIRKTKKEIDENNVEQSQKTAYDVIKVIDKAAQKGILKKNTAARKKSRLMKKVNAIKKNT